MANALETRTTQRTYTSRVEYAYVYRGGVKVYLHKEAAEKTLGRPLPEEAQIHHVDENPANYRNDNLVICQDDAYHKLLHQRLRAYRACGDANWLRCVLCHEYDAPEKIKVYSSGWSVHPFCAAKYVYERRHGKGSYLVFRDRKD